MNFKIWLLLSYEFKLKIKNFKIIYKYLQFVKIYDVIFVINMPLVFKLRFLNWCRYIIYCCLLRILRPDNKNRNLFKFFLILWVFFMKRLKILQKFVCHFEIFHFFEKFVLRILKFYENKIILHYKNFMKFLFLKWIKSHT